MLPITLAIRGDETIPVVTECWTLLWLAKEKRQFLWQWRWPLHLLAREEKKQFLLRLSVGHYSGWPRRRDNTCSNWVLGTTLAGQEDWLYLKWLSVGHRRIDSTWSDCWSLFGWPGGETIPGVTECWPLSWLASRRASTWSDWVLATILTGQEGRLYLEWLSVGHYPGWPGGENIPGVTECWPLSWLARRGDYTWSDWVLATILAGQEGRLYLEWLSVGHYPGSPGGETIPGVTECWPLSWLARVACWPPAGLSSEAHHSSQLEQQRIGTLTTKSISFLFKTCV